MEFRLDDGQVALRDTIARFCADHFGFDRAAAHERQPVDRDAVARARRSRDLQDHDPGGRRRRRPRRGRSHDRLRATRAPPRARSVRLVDARGVDRRRRRRAANDSSAGSNVPPLATEPILVEHAVRHRRARDAHSRRRDRVGPRGTARRPRRNRRSIRCTPVGRVRVAAERRAGRRRRRRGRSCACSAPSSARPCSSASPRARSTVARDYALEREQFGVPIGSFQAVKHMLADMYVRTSLARSATYAAAAVYDDPGDRRTGSRRRHRQAPRRRSGDRQRARRGAGARRHGLHVGHAAELPPEARVGARALVRDLRRPRARVGVVDRGLDRITDGLRDDHLRRRRSDRDDHVQPSRSAQRGEPADDPRAPARVRRGRVRRRGVDDHHHRRGPRVLRRRRRDRDPRRRPRHLRRALPARRTRSGTRRKRRHRRSAR